MIREQFLPIPYCPSANVTLCAVGACYTTICEALNSLGIQVLEISNNEKLSPPVQGHADLQLAVLEGNRVLIGKGESPLKNLLLPHGFEVSETNTPLCNQYPREALLDFVSLGNRIIGNTPIFKEERLLNNSQIIHVKQGYTKCNIALINKNTLISSDPSIASVCRDYHFDVLQIRSGFIELPGYHHGFIGGCCGLISPDCLAVCGKLSTHPDYHEIVQFLHKHHVTVVELCDGPLIDIGSIIPLKQKNIDDYSNDCSKL